MIDDMKLWQYPGIGTWYIRIGNKRISLKTKDKNEAQAILRRYQKDALKGKLIHLNKSEKLSNFIESALENFKAKNTPAYHTSMKYSLNYFLDCTGDKDISHITKRDLDRFVQHRLNAGYSRTTVNIDVRNIKASLTLAVEWDIMQKNPLYGYKQLKIDRKAPRFLQMKDIHKMLEVIDDHTIKRAFLFYVLTGCRREEILNLTWQDIDLEMNVIHIRKTKTHLERHIPISASLRKVIDDIPSQIGQLFPLHKDTMSHKMKKYLVAAGFGSFRLHDLRHTFASLLAISGETTKTIGELLGHTDPRTTEIYAHLSQDHLENAVNKINLNI